MAVEPPLMLSLSYEDAELPWAISGDAGEALIDLEQVDVIDAEVGGLQGLAGGVQDGSELHNGTRSRNRQSPEPCPRDQAALLGEAAAGNEQGGRERSGQADRGRDDS